VALAGCGGSSAAKSPAAVSATTAAASTDAPVTISTASLPGLGTVLINGTDGRTLYLLTSEQGGKITCTDDSGCTKVWPDTELPKGVTTAGVGTGIDASKLSTVKSDDGDVYPTYGGWPLYEYSGDPKAGVANGQGITSFGGTWWAVSAAGAPVTTKP
jgi:predicted lipoprotein with Yx(FWY)xxD motif